MTDPRCPPPWAADDPDEAYENWLAWVDAGADPNEPDWRATT